MDKFLESYEEFCENPSIKSGKAKSYVNAIKYLCNYLNINTINKTVIVEFKNIESEIRNNKSILYNELLYFLQTRKQSSYLTDGYIGAALNQLYRFWDIYEKQLLNSTNNNHIYFYNEITKDEWINIFSNQIFSEDIKSAIKILYLTDKKRLNAKNIAEILNTKHFVVLNKIVGQFGQNIYSMLNLKNPPIRENGEIRWWNIVFDGVDSGYDNNPYFDWILKAEMIEAIKELDLFGKVSKSKNYNNNDDLYPIIKEYELIDNFIGKERTAIIKVRQNQGKLRKQAIKKHQGNCMLCNMKIQSLLIASHIKEWVDSTSVEKTDINNVLLLCPNHDSLFDKHLISFTDNGDILINKNISDEDRQKLNLNQNMQIKVTQEMIPYLNYHRDIFNKLNK